MVITAVLEALGSMVGAVGRWLMYDASSSGGAAAMRRPGVLPAPPVEPLLLRIAELEAATLARLRRIDEGEPVSLIRQDLDDLRSSFGLGAS